ncbi:hypothetical protein ASD11_04860 [Aeromicrobium sp. Root495]|uniref:LPXTG cell wall anchor domain-containing protein n=1 Tax=Aeromicrobium sp. Root495 TaxID=1736550 RepID=UPI0006FE9540|nr:LPXTG cell wall anchor domain-containing protein [Aeromicrobium sp. Root495]KQY58953.1 hypothetical protein ASD11_04860 [Aeromicrobium sp. Root495]
MWKFCATVLLALGLVLPGVAASAADDAYPDPTVAIIIDPDVCIGQPLPFIGKSSVDGDWTVTYLGQTKTGSGKNFAVDFSTKKAKAGQSVTLRAVQTYDGGSLTRTATINLPKCTDQAAGGADLGDGVGNAGNDGLSGILPNTGGLAFWVIVLGVVLAVAGSVTLARRRS